MKLLVRRWLQERIDALEAATRIYREVDRDLYRYGLCGADNPDEFRFSIEGHDWTPKVWSLAIKEFERGNLM